MEMIPRLNSISEVKGITLSGYKAPNIAVMEQVGRLQALRSLTTYSESDVKQLAHMPVATRHRLHTLGLLDTAFTDDEMIEIARLFPNVTNFSFIGQNLTSACISSLSTLRLSTIHVRKPSRKLQAALGGLESVSSVTLEEATSNDFTNLPPNIRFLRCQRATIRQGDFEQLTGYETLEQVKAENTYIDPNDVAAFKSACPDCAFRI